MLTLALPCQAQLLGAHQAASQAAALEEQLEAARIEAAQLRHAQQAVAASPGGRVQVDARGEHETLIRWGPLEAAW